MRERMVKAAGYIPRKMSYFNIPFTSLEHIPFTGFECIPFTGFEIRCHILDMILCLGGNRYSSGNDPADAKFPTPVQLYLYL